MWADSGESDEVTHMHFFPPESHFSADTHCLKVYSRRLEECLPGAFFALFLFN